MLSIVTPAVSRRLTTIPAVRDHLQLGDEVDDLYLADLIDQASDAIARDCDRVFGRRVFRQTFAWRRHPVGLRLADRPAEILNVMESGLVVDSTLYELDEEDGRLYRLNTLGERAGWDAPTTAVTFSAGWILPGHSERDLPASVEQACMTILAARIAAKGRDPMLRSESTEGVGSTSFIATADMAGIPPQATALLAPFRRWAVG